MNLSLSLKTRQMMEQSETPVSTLINKMFSVLFDAFSSNLALGTKPSKLRAGRKKNTQRTVTFEIGTPESVTDKAEISRKMHYTVCLLESTITLLDAVYHQPDTKAVIDDLKNDCATHLAELGKIIGREYAHFENLHRVNRYQEKIDSLWKSHVGVKYGNGDTLAPFVGMDLFRHVFSEVILEIRNKCSEYCNELSDRGTYEQGAIYDSCMLVTKSLNEISRQGLDLVVHQYEYDQPLELLSVGVSVLGVTPDYGISQVYWDGQHCRFYTSPEEKFALPHHDRVIYFYLPAGAIDDGKEHMLTIMIQCAEFSFVVKGTQKDYARSSPSPKKRGIQPIRFLTTACCQNMDIPLVLAMGGEIKKIIESLADREFLCSYCHEEHQCKRWVGCPHVAGIPDKNGKKYWMVVFCSNHKVPLHRILRNLVEQHVSGVC